MMYNEPSMTPWGEVQSCTPLSYGVFSVSTAGHGGIMVNVKIAPHILSKDARRCGFRQGGYLCFEEDCAAPVAIRELMDKRLFTPPVNRYYEPGEYEACIDRSLQRWNPEYWNAREQRLAADLETPIKRSKERER